jgi:hypothetical protein
MQTTAEHHAKVAKLTFGTVYPLYVKKIERKGRTKEELHQVIEWLTGYTEKQILEQVEANVSFEHFFSTAKLHPNASFIKGVICGYRIEEIENPLTKQVRYLDKLIDELANGKKLEKIFR